MGLGHMSASEITIEGCFSQLLIQGFSFFPDGGGLLLSRVRTLQFVAANQKEATHVGHSGGQPHGESSQRREAKSSTVHLDNTDGRHGKLASHVAPSPCRR
jgi:hypothetical protein